LTVIALCNPLTLTSLAQFSTHLTGQQSTTLAKTADEKRDLQSQKDSTQAEFRNRSLVRDPQTDPETIHRVNGY